MFFLFFYNIFFSPHSQLLFLFHRAGDGDNINHINSCSILSWIFHTRTHTLADSRFDAVTNGGKRDIKPKRAKRLLLWFSYFFFAVLKKFSFPFLCERFYYWRPNACPNLLFKFSFLFFVFFLWRFSIFQWGISFYLRLFCARS